jgi:hypothetical protein
MATDLLTTANQSTVKVVSFAQDQVLRVYKTLASKAPSTPSWLAPARERSKETIEQAFTFQSQLLESSKAFTLGLIDAGARSSERTATEK